MSNVIPIREDDPTGWDTIPVECKAEFQRGMARHPSGGRGTRTTAPQHRAHTTPAPRRGVLRWAAAVGTIAALSMFVGMGIFILALYFGLV
jgi:hypothetical protein